MHCSSENTIFLPARGGHQLFMAPYLCVRVRDESGILVKFVEFSARVVAEPVQKPFQQPEARSRREAGDAEFGVADALQKVPCSREAAPPGR